MIGHIALTSGFIATSNPAAVIATGILAANLPDFDMPFFSLRKNHRLYSPAHQPFWWIVLITAAMPVVRIIHPSYLPYVILGITGLITHFVMDCYDSTAGIKLFAPFSPRVYSFFRTKNEDLRTVRDITLNFFRHNLAMESAVIAVSVIVTRFF